MIRKIRSRTRPQFLSTRLLATGALIVFSLAARSGIAADADNPGAGQAVYDKKCGGCHNPGPGAFFSGAPRIGSDAWKARLAVAGSVDALVISAAKGKGKMPAQGGTSGLPDSDLKSAIEYILSKSPA